MNIGQLARAAADKDKVDPFKNGLWVLTPQELQRFHALAIEQEHKRLLEGSGEPVAKFNWNAGEFEWLTKYNYSLLHNKPLYTADQLAAAVLRERERCAALVDNHFDYTRDECAAAIRGQA